MKNHLVFGMCTMLLSACAAELDEDNLAGPDASEPIPDAGDTDDGTDSEPLDEDALSAPPIGCPSLNIKTDFGAKGDGTTNDTIAFQKAAARIQTAKCGELIIPPATYIVGAQTKKTSPTTSGPYYKEQPIFSVRDLTYLHIYAYGAKLKIADGLHYGAFDKATGAPIDVTGGTDNAADVGRIIEVSTSNNVFVEGGEYDGNNTKLVLGGQWGDKQRQTAATGLWFDKCLKVTVRDIYTHHHGLDGITVLHRHERPTVKKPHKLYRVRSEYNGRQGLSWIGGWGLEVYDSKFNHTGRAINVGGGRDNGLPLYAAPGAGLDIEPNAGTVEISREGLFRRTEFINNTGAGLVADVGDGGYSTFDDCTFWGTSSYSMWVRQPGLRFLNSRIYGTGVHVSNGSTDESPAPNAALATYFENTLFEDKPWTDGTVKRSGSLYNVNAGEGQGATWKNCTFRNHAVKAIIASDTTTREIFEGCTFMHDNEALGNGASQSVFAGSQLTGVQFRESTAITAGTRNYFIDVSNVRVVDSSTPTRVDGPRIHWDTPTGRTGVIPAGTY